MRYENNDITIEYNDVKKLFENIPSVKEINDENYWKVASLYCVARTAFEEMDYDDQRRFKKECYLLWRNGEEVYEKIG